MPKKPTKKSPVKKKSPISKKRERISGMGGLSLEEIRRIAGEDVAEEIKMEQRIKDIEKRTESQQLGKESQLKEEREKREQRLEYKKKKLEEKIKDKRKEIKKYKEASSKEYEISETKLDRLTKEFYVEKLDEVKRDLNDDIKDLYMTEARLKAYDKILEDVKELRYQTKKQRFDELKTDIKRDAAQLYRDKVQGKDLSKEQRNQMKIASYWEAYLTKFSSEGLSPENVRGAYKSGQNLRFNTAIFVSDDTDLLNNYVKNENVNRLITEWYPIKEAVNEHLINEGDLSSDTKEQYRMVSDFIESAYYELKYNYIHRFVTSSEKARNQEVEELLRSDRIQDMEKFFRKKNGNEFRKQDIDDFFGQRAPFVSLLQKNIISHRRAEFLRNAVLLSKNRLAKLMVGNISNEIRKNQKKIQELKKQKKDYSNLLVENSQLYVAMNFYNWQLDIPPPKDDEQILKDIGYQVGRGESLKEKRNELLNTLYNNAKDFSDKKLASDLEKIFNIEQRPKLEKTMEERFTHFFGEKSKSDLRSEKKAALDDLKDLYIRKGMSPEKAEKEAKQVYRNL